MPDEKKCNEIADWCDSLCESEVKFLTWLICKQIKDNYNPYMKAPTSKQEYLEWNADRTVYEGLKMLEELLGYEW